MKYNIDNYLNLCHLEGHDEIYFPLMDGKIAKYMVYPCWLSFNGIGDETFILQYLQEHHLINDPYIFLTECYGYAPTIKPKEVWPECKAEDYSALKRAIIAIFELLQKLQYSCKVKQIELKNNEFELLCLQ